MCYKLFKGMKKKLVQMVVIFTIALFSVLMLFRSKIRLDYSNGGCNHDDECEWVGEVCGGGHGVCTSNKEKNNNEFQIGSCDVNNNFPHNQGYNCGCVKLLGRCGWEKN